MRAGIDLSTPSGLAWHALRADAVIDNLGTRAEGLSQNEVTERKRVFGQNRLRPPRKRHAIRRFVLQFHNVLIYVLLAAALMTAFLGHWVDTGVIVGVVIINALIGFFQEGKAEKALDAMRDILSHQATVRRNGHTIVISAEELVPGDLVTLQSGDKVPADIRLITTKDLRVDEAILTGESLPADKSTAPVDEGSSIGDRTCIAYSGTLVTYGIGSGIVVATGESTEIGRISALLRNVQTLTTPLVRQMAVFAKWLSGVIVLLAAGMFLFGILVRDYSVAEMFLAAVGLTVAAIPEGLPAIMTITLAIGVQRMATKNAIIRWLPAVETLGSVTVICSDKTGTLTRNEMTVQAVATSTGQFEVTGVGYNPHGAFLFEDKEIVPADFPILAEVAQAAALCNDATVEHVNGDWRMAGDPTEGGLITLGIKSGIDTALQRQEWPRADVIPFESQHRFMATLHHDHAGHAFIYAKGAPERIVEMCAFQRMPGNDRPVDHVYWQQQIEGMARRGLRLLAIAFKATEHGHRELRFSDVETSLTLLGIVGIIDPPRDEAIHAIRLCRAAGIHVKMITGDHAITAAAIGLQMGIGDGRRLLTGHDLDLMSDESLAESVEDTDIFARTSPEHKLRLVTALQAAGHVVAMTGDGVNDAPALKRADVGIAMGRKGTEVTKEAAEMVLTDDNFASITHAIKEGRTVFDNLKKAILFILPTNGGEAFTLIVAILLGFSLPITPVQILWVNMITAVTLSLALAFEPPEPGVMKRPPRDPAKPILSSLLIWRIFFVTLILVAGTFGLFVWEYSNGSDLDTARTVAVNALVMFEIFYLFNSRYIFDTVFSIRGFLGNRYALIAVTVLILFQIGFTYLESMQMLFGTKSLDIAAWLRIILVSSSVLILVECEKYLIRLYKGRRGNYMASDKC